MHAAQVRKQLKKETRNGMLAINLLFQNQSSANKTHHANSLMKIEAKKQHLKPQKNRQSCGMKSTRKFIIISMLLSTFISLAIIYDTYLYGIEYVFTKTNFFYYFAILSFLIISSFSSIIIIDKIHNDKISNLNKFIYEFNKLYNDKHRQNKSHADIENLETSILLLKQNTLETIETLIESLEIISKSHNELKETINNDLLLKMKSKYTIQ